MELAGPVIDCIDARPSRKLLFSTLLNLHWLRLC